MWLPSGFDILRAVVDIGIVSYIIYRIMYSLRGTRAGQMAFGLLIVVSAFILSQYLNLTMLQWMLNNFLSSIVLILIVIFQNDIRKALVQVGKNPFFSSVPSFGAPLIIEEIVKAVNQLAGRKIGAIIAIERKVILNDFIEIGTKIDANVTKEILMSIFLPYSPIHDGAVIIQRGRITAAGCVLPLSSTRDLAPDLGTRHRAALGLSEETDAVVIVVSEERGEISVAVDGSLYRNLAASDLRFLLYELFEEGKEKPDETLFAESEV